MLKKLLIITVCSLTFSLNCMQYRTPEQQAVLILKQCPESLRVPLRCSIAILLNHHDIPALSEGIQDFLTQKIKDINAFIQQEEGGTKKIMKALAASHIYPNDIELFWQYGPARKFFLFLDRLAHVVEDYHGVYLRIYCCKCMDDYVFKDAAIQVWLEQIIKPKSSLEIFSDKARALAQRVDFEALRLGVYKHCAQEVLNQLQAIKPITPTTLEHEKKQTDC